VALHSPPDSIFLCQPLHLLWRPTPATTLWREYLLADLVDQCVVIAIAMLCTCQRSRKPRTTTIFIRICVRPYLLVASFEQSALKHIGLGVNEHMIVCFGHAGAVVSWRVLRLPNYVRDASLFAKDFI